MAGINASGTVSLKLVGGSAAKINPPTITTPSKTSTPVPNLQFTMPTNQTNGPTPQQRIRDNGKKIADANPILAAGINNMQDINVKNGAWAAIGLLATTQDSAAIDQFKSTMDKNWLGGFNVGKNAAIGIQHITPTGNALNDFGAAIAWDPNFAPSTGTPPVQLPGPTEPNAFAPPASVTNRVAPPLFAPDVKDSSTFFTSSSAPQPVQIPAPYEATKTKVPTWLIGVLGAVGLGGIFFYMKRGKKR